VELPGGSRRRIAAGAVGPSGSGAVGETEGSAVLMRHHRLHSVAIGNDSAFAWARIFGSERS
jgi:hypothetical protein